MKLTQLRQLQRNSVGYLLIRAGQLWNERAITAVNAKAGVPVLREAHTRLLPLLMHEEGSRLIDLARRLGLTKQAVQPLIAELKELGVVRILPDSDDKRASRIVLTPLGRTGIARGTEILCQVEAELVGRLGSAEMVKLRGLLARLLAALESDAAGPVER